MILYIHASCQIIHFTTSILATLESILHQQPKWPFDNISQISHSHFLTLPMALTTLRIKPRNIPQLTGPYMVHRTTPPALHSGPSASFLHPVHILGSLLLFFRAFILAAPSALNILTKYSHCSPSSFSHTEYFPDHYSYLSLYSALLHNFQPPTITHDRLSPHQSFAVQYNTRYPQVPTEHLKCELCCKCKIHPLIQKKKKKSKIFYWLHAEIITLWI